MDFSLIVPCYNEEGNIEAFLREATRVFDAQEFSYEIVMVDDGSSDKTMQVLHSLRDGWLKETRAEVQVISFSRNFGKEAAMYAGLEAARGDCMGFIDADLQQHPETSLEMYRHLLEDPDCDCVAAIQRQRKEGAILKFFKGCFYRVFNMMSETDLVANASDFRVFRRMVAEALLSMKESYRFSKGLFSWVGFHLYTIEYEPDARLTGSSSWSFKKLMSYGLGGILSFSTMPLRIVFFLGIIASLAAIVYLIVVLIETLVVGDAPSGYPTLVCLMLLFGGIILLALGIFGDYLGRIYVEGKNRPVYIARESFEMGRSECVNPGRAGSERANSGCADPEGTGPECVNPGCANEEGIRQ
jgi:glycosyltransferase involved in cell wall biosynthesis